MVPPVVPVAEGKVRMNGIHWVLYADAGEGVEGARDGQSSVSVGVDGDSPHAGEGCHGRDSARKLEARGAARTHNLSHRTVHHPRGCRPAGAHSSGSCEGTSATHGEASAGTDAGVSGASRAGMRTRRGVESRGEMRAGGGSPCRGPVGRSGGGRETAVDLARGGHSWACEQQGSR